MVQVEVCATMEPQEQEVPIEQVPDEPLDQIGHPPTRKDPMPGESMVPYA